MQKILDLGILKIGQYHRLNAIGNNQGVVYYELNEIAALGLKMARYAAFAAAAVGVWWLLSLPGELKFYTDHSLWLGIVLAVVLIALLLKAGSCPVRYAIPLTLVSFLTVLVMCISRETLRVGYLGQFDYSAAAYPVSIDWASTILFLVTFVLGLFVLAYLLKIAFVSGRYKLVNRAEAP